MFLRSKFGKVNSLAMQHPLGKWSIPKDYDRVLSHFISQSMDTYFRAQGNEFKQHSLISSNRRHLFFNQIPSASRSSLPPGAFPVSASSQDKFIKVTTCKLSPLERIVTYVEESSENGWEKHYKKGITKVHGQYTTTNTFEPAVSSKILGDEAYYHWALLQAY